MMVTASVGTPETCTRSASGGAAQRRIARDKCRALQHTRRPRPTRGCPHLQRDVSRGGRVEAPPQAIEEHVEDGRRCVGVGARSSAPAACRSLRALLRFGGLAKREEDAIAKREDCGLLVRERGGHLQQRRLGHEVARGSRRRGGHTPSPEAAGGAAGLPGARPLQGRLALVVLGAAGRGRQRRRRGNGAHGYVHADAAALAVRVLRRSSGRGGGGRRERSVSHQVLS